MAATFEIATTTARQPKRIVLYGPEGVGKTSLCAFAPSPVFLQIRGETGLQTLMDAGQLPDTAHVPDTIETWKGVLDVVDWLTTSKHDHKTLVIDTMDGVEQLCFDYVRKGQFEDSSAKFLNYGKGPKAALVPWRSFLQKLDKLRAAKTMGIFCIAHTAVISAPNPDADDFLRHAAALNEKTTWAATKRWADAILFYTFDVAVSDGKGKGGERRIIHTKHTATHDAKNRYGLPAEIAADGGGEAAWGALLQAFQDAKKGTTK